MQISIDYADGRIREFNTSDYVSLAQRSVVASEPGASNFVTELDLRLDRLKEDGLRLDIYMNLFGWSTGQKVDFTEELGPRSGGQRRMVDMAMRYLYGTVQLISPAELEDASYILVNRCGATVPVAWRQGSGQWLIDGMAFAKTARQIYTDPRVTSTNAQEILMMGYLTRAYPDMDIRDLVKMTGFIYEAYREAQSQEIRNKGASVGQEPTAESDQVDHVPEEDAPEREGPSTREGAEPEEGGPEDERPEEIEGIEESDIIVDGEWDEDDEYEDE